MDERERKISKLKAYFKKRDDVVMAFLFGSQAKGKGRIHAGSDWDIAVYFKPENNDFEFEDTAEYPQEDRVWADLTGILKTDKVDLVVLNNAPSTIADTAIRGEPLVIKNRRLWLRFMFLITKLAEEYRRFARDYHKILQRSRSLSPEDRERLERLIDFLEEQSELYPVYRGFSEGDYTDDPRKRNEIERWLENIVNAVIDCAKAMLGSKKYLIPPTYREVVRRALRLAKLPEEFETRFESWVRLRNILAHEYLDIKWKRISKFAKTSEPFIRRFIESSKKFLKKTDEL